MIELAARRCLPDIVGVCRGAPGRRIGVQTTGPGRPLQVQSCWGSCASSRLDDCVMTCLGAHCNPNTNQGLAKEMMFFSRLALLPSMLCQYTIEDAGKAICHSRRRILFQTAGSRTRKRSWREWTPRWKGGYTQNQRDLSSKNANSKSHNSGFALCRYREK